MVMIYLGGDAYLRAYGGSRRSEIARKEYVKESV